MWRCLFWPSFCRLPWTWQEMRPVLFRKHYTLRDGVLVCFQLPRSLLLLIFNFLSPLLFWLVYKEFSNYYFIACIRNPTRLLTWSFLQKQLTTEGPCVCVCVFFFFFLRNLHLRCLTEFLIHLCVDVWDLA